MPGLYSLTLAIFQAGPSVVLAACRAAHVSPLNVRRTIFNLVQTISQCRRSLTFGSSVLGRVGLRRAASRRPPILVPACDLTLGRREVVPAVSRVSMPSSADLGLAFACRTTRLVAPRFRICGSSPLRCYPDDELPFCTARHRKFSRRLFSSRLCRS